jgi:hypothetical protein
METFSLTVQRTQGGGYIAWCLINGQPASGHPSEPAPPHAARSTLQEIMQMTTLPLMEKQFGERAVIYPSSSLPPIDDSINLPAGVRPDHYRNGQEHGGGLMDRLRSASITILPAAWTLMPLIALASA